MIVTHKTNCPLVALILVAGLFAGAQFGKLTLTLAQMQLAYPDNMAMVPVLVSIVGIVGIVFGAVAGALSARLGLTRVLILAMILGGALSLVQTTMPPVWLFAVLRVLEGVSHLAIVVTAPPLLASISTDADRPVVMGIWACFFGFALAILAAILPGLLSIGGLPTVFGAHGVGMIVMSLALWRALPIVPAPNAPRPAYLQEHRIIYSTPRLIIPGAGFMWYTIIYVSLLAVLPLMLGLTAWQTTSLPLISIIGTLAGGFIAKRVAPNQVVVAGFAMTAGAAGLIALMPGALWPLYILFLVMALIPAGSFASIPHFNERVTDRARATGGIAQLGNVGTTLGTPVFVFAGQLGGMPALLLCMLAFCLIGIATTTLLRRRIGPLSK